MNKYFFLILLSIPLFASCQDKSDNQYVINRNIYKTNLTKFIKAPQSYEDFEEKRDSIILIKYTSENKELKGLLDISNVEEGKKKPVMVYLHGGFSLGYQDMIDCKPFIDAGFIVFAPTYRAENGNDGNFEMFYGEVDDAKAAIKWVSQQEYANADSIFVFGHSIGGGISLLLSFQNDIKVKRTASNAGLYTEEDMKVWDESGKIPVPFNYNDENEYSLRFPYAYLNYMVRQHTMYIGTEDDFEFWNNWINKSYEQKLYINLIGIKGDHFSSLAPSMQLFIEKIRSGK